MPSVSSQNYDGSFSHLPRWTVRMQPDIYMADRVASSGYLQRLVQESAISLRGWTFPIVGRVAGAEWSNFESGSQSYFNREGQRPEALRAYKSGMFIWSSGLGEDTWQGLTGENVISFIALIFSVTEWVLFAKRFYETILSVDEQVHLIVSASGVKARRLISADPRVILHGDFRTEVAELKIHEIVGVSELRADPEAIARKIIRRIFEMFNWNNPDENMLVSRQQALIQRQF